ncbi:hypothetical protein [Jatrophihabitans sp.]|uniref:hypothetical protein n=1 Tax=Jatrophihabitans sp. TaxID=1932789 RepID=UPI0030C71485|nr:putative rane protein [Jatrophihabitans sp.]
MNDWVNLSALWRIVVIGLLTGAGLPALFAVGLRALGAGSRVPATAGAPVGRTGGGSVGGSAGAPASDDRIVGGSPLGLAAAVVCFAVVLGAIGWGIYFIVNGS